MKNAYAVISVSSNIWGWCRNMNKPAIKITLCCCKYISFLMLTALIVVNSNILSGILNETLEKYVADILSICHRHEDFVFMTLLICLSIYLIFSFVIYFIKMDNESDLLELEERDCKLKIEKIDKKYDKISEKTNFVKDEILKAETSLKTETYSKVYKIKQYCTKIEYHYESRNNNYFNTNKNFYKIVKSSKKLDENTLKLIEEFENEISG